MRRDLLRFTTVALTSCAGAAVLTGAAPPKPTTEWLARPGEAARVKRVEASLPPLKLPGQEPEQLSLQRWMEVYKIPGLSVAVFDKNTLVWAKTYGVKQAGGSEPVALEEGEEAIDSYKQSLKLDPKNTHAVEMLKKLGAKPE